MPLRVLVSRWIHTTSTPGCCRALAPERKQPEPPSSSSSRATPATGCWWWARAAWVPSSGAQAAPLTFGGVRLPARCHMQHHVTPTARHVLISREPSVHVPTPADLMVRTDVARDSAVQGCGWRVRRADMSMVGLGSVSSCLVQNTTLAVAVVGPRAAEPPQIPDVSLSTISAFKTPPRPGHVLPNATLPGAATMRCWTFLQQPKG